jgi:hypothetical protein
MLVFFLKDEDFYCSLDVLYGGLGIKKLHFSSNFISYVNFFQFLVIKTLDLDPDSYPDPH